MHRMNGDSARRAGRLLASAPLLVVLLLVAQADPAAGQMGVGFDVPNAVIVVGAGMSGIAAARTLADKNIYSIVLEAQNRVGGRLKTDRSLGFPVDLGASWIHGPTRPNAQGKTNPLTPLADAYKLKRVTTPDDKLLRWRFDGTAYTDGQQTTHDTTFNDLMSTLRTARNALNTDQSVQTTISGEADYALDPIQWRLSSDTEFQYGAALSQLSAINFDSDNAFRGADVLFPDGYDRMINSSNLGKNIDIRLNSNVVSIDYSNYQKIVVSCADGKKYTSAAVIVTVPLGILKKGNITFTPALPASFTAATTRLKAGTTNKLMVQFDRQILTDEQMKYIWFGIDRTPNPNAAAKDVARGMFNTWINLKPVFGVDGFMGFMFGKYGENAEALSRADIKTAFMESIRTVWPNAPEPINFVYSKWYTDPYTFGCYSYAAVGSSNADFQALSEPVGPDAAGAAATKSLFFAGEHTSADYRGTVHGAYITGVETANKVRTNLQVDWGSYAVPSYMTQAATITTQVTVSFTDTATSVSAKIPDIINAFSTVTGMSPFFITVPSVSAIEVSGRRRLLATGAQATVNIAAPTAANQAAVQAILADSTKLAALFAQLSASGMSPVPSSLTAKRADAAAPAPDNKLPLILGLAIGLGGGLLVAGGVGFWYYRRRKNSSRSQPAMGKPGQQYSAQDNALDTAAVPAG